MVVPSLVVLHFCFNFIINLFGQLLCEIMCSRTNASSDSRLPENAKALPCLDVVDAVRGHVGMAVDLEPRQVKQRNHLKCLQKKQQREFQSGEGANVSRSHDSQLWLRKSGLCAEMFG